MLSFNFDLLTIGLVVAAILILGFIIFYSDYKSTTSRLFLLFTIATSGWAIFNYFSYQVYEYEISLWIVRLVMFFAMYQAFSFFLLMHSFPKKELRMSKKLLLALSVVVVAVSLLTLTPAVFPEVKLMSGEPPEPVPAPGIAAFALVAVSQVLGGIFILIKKTIKAEKEDRGQFLFLLIGAFLMFALILFFNFISVAVFGNSSFIPLTGIFMLPFVLFTSYAIIKHQLLNVKIIATEILVFFLIIVMFFQVLFAESLEEIVLVVVILFALIIIGILLIRSVINEVKHREQLQDLTDKLKALDKKKDEFISIAAHELRTPLTAINGYVSMLLDEDVGKLPGGAMEVLDRTSLAADRMVRLISNLLDVGRIEEGRIIYKMDYVNLVDVVKTVFDEFETEAKMRNLELALDIQDNIKDKVYVDSDRIHEVVGNLLTNAFKYTEKGSIKVKVKNPSENYIKVEVEDTGLGIPPSDQKKLFQKYYRSESSAGKIEGTGLGLYVMKLLVEKFAGKVGVASVVDKGSKFWFELPIAKGDEEKINEKSEGKSKG